MSRRFFSGKSLKVAVLAAASHYKVDPDELAYQPVEKKQGRLRATAKVVIAVDPANPVKAPGEPDTGSPAKPAKPAKPAEKAPGRAAAPPVEAPELEESDDDEPEPDDEPEKDDSGEDSDDDDSDDDEDSDDDDESEDEDEDDWSDEDSDDEDSDDEDDDSDDDSDDDEVDWYESPALDDSDPYALDDDPDGNRIEGPPPHLRSHRRPGDELPGRGRGGRRQGGRSGQGGRGGRGGGQASGRTQGGGRSRAGGQPKDGGQAESGGRSRGGGRPPARGPKEGGPSRGGRSQPGPKAGDRSQGGRPGGRGPAAEKTEPKAPTKPERGGRSRGRGGRGRSGKSGGALVDLPPEPRPLAERLERADGELAEAARQAVALIGELAGIKLEAEVLQGEDRLEIDLSTPHSELLMAEDGELLVAIEHLLPRVMRGFGDETAAVRVDCENFQEIREEKLRSFAQQVASEVRKSGRSRSLTPLSPSDRRIVHMAIATEPGVDSESDGRGFLKRVRVSPV